jgi:phage tail sheath protein FI
MEDESDFPKRGNSEPVYRQRIDPDTWDPTVETGMTEILFPGVCVEEIETAAHPIPGVSTDVAGFVGFTERGSHRPKLVTSFAQFKRIFGVPVSPERGFLPYAVEGFFENGGRKAYVARVGRATKAKVAASVFIGNPRAKPSRRRGLAGLADIQEISMLALPDAAHPRVPGKVRRSILAAAVAQCDARRDRIVFIDVPAGARDLGQSDPIIRSIESSYAAVHGPWLEVPQGKRGLPVSLPPSGQVVGIYARNDNDRGVWKELAGMAAEVRGISGLTLNLTEKELETLADARINAIADFRNAGRGIRLWGARSRSVDADWKYISVRRLVIFIEASIDRGLQWVVFEPNGETLWANVRATVEDFLLAQWRKGAFPGTKPEQAFFVRCDRTTMTQNDIDNGRLICLIGVAPLKPAEFVVVRIGLWTAKKTANPDYSCSEEKPRHRVIKG